MPTYESHVTTSPVFDKPAKIVYPFAKLGDYTTKEVWQPLLQLADRYAPPTIGAVFVGATDANFSGSPVTIGSAYCIGDTEPQETEAGLVSFTRKWSNIPATNTDYIGSTTFTYPSVITTTGTYKTIASIGSISGLSATYTVTAHGYANGDQVRIWVSTGTGLSTHAYTSIISGVTTDTFSAAYLIPAGASFVSGSVISSTSFGSSTRTRVVNSYVVSEFCLPGVTSGFATVDDFIPYPLFDVVDFNGNSVTAINGVTAPSNQEYSAMVASGQGLIRDSLIERYAGNIYVRKTTYVKAI